MSEDAGDSTIPQIRNSNNRIGQSSVALELPPGKAQLLLFSIFYLSEGALSSTPFLSFFFLCSIFLRFSGAVESTRPRNTRLNYLSLYSSQMAMTVMAMTNKRHNPRIKALYFPGGYDAEHIPHHPQPRYAEMAIQSLRALNLGRRRRSALSGISHHSCLILTPLLTHIA